MAMKLMSKSDDLFASGCEALVNAVNCVGIMGAGIALAFRQQFPDYYTDYCAKCKKKSLRPGKVDFYQQDRVLATDPIFIVSFPTLSDLHHPPEMKWIESGLESLCKEIVSHRISSIAIPALGCGITGLAWPTVLSLMKTILKPCSRKSSIFIYPPR